MNKEKVLLILCAFGGGIILSLTELTNMLKMKEIPDLFFFGGLLIAGIFGVIGFFIAGASSFRTAFVSGVSAPQLLSGLVKLGTVGVQTVSCILVPMTYANPRTIDVKVILKQVDQVEMRTNDSTYLIQDSIDIRIPYQDTLIFVGEDVNEIVELEKADATRIIITNKKTGWQSLLRGMFAQKQKDKVTILKE
jgi:hypothetical protein